MQKRLKAVSLALKMVFSGYMIDGLNSIICSSALGKRKIDVHLMFLLDKILFYFRCDFEAAEEIYLMLCEVKPLKMFVKE